MGEGGVREKSLLVELQDLNIEDNIKERLVGKYWDEMEKYREDIKTLRMINKIIEDAAELRASIISEMFSMMCKYGLL